MTVEIKESQGSSQHCVSSQSHVVFPFVVPGVMAWVVGTVPCLAGVEQAEPAGSIIPAEQLLGSFLRDRCVTGVTKRW